MGALGVDPVQLAAAGRCIASHSEALETALEGLASALAASGHMCGNDPAGKAFALNYRRGGQALFSAAEAAVGACRNVGYGIEVSASNYAHSEAAATVGGGAVSVPTPISPPCVSGPAMPNPSGPAVGEPYLWALVSQFVGAPWPDGNPSTLRAAASAWRDFASTLDGVSGDIDSGSGSVSGHDVPELSCITEAISQVSSGVRDLAGQCVAIATTLEGFADEIETSQQAIRDLLNRLSASRIGQTVIGIFAGRSPMEDIRAVANDIKEIVHTLGREADAVSTMFQESITALDGLTTRLEDWARREFTHFLGEDVGGALADAFTTNVDLAEGVGKSLIDTAGGIEHLATHPQELAKLAVEANPLAQAMGFASDPRGFIDGKVETAKGLLDAKDWTSDHPMRGLGHNVGTAAQMLVPGLGGAKAGATGGRVAEEAAQAGRVEGNAARAGAEIAGGGTGADVAAQGSRIGHDLSGVGLTPAEAPVASAPVRPVEPVPTIKPTDPGVGRAPVDAPVGPRAPDPPPVSPREGGAAGPGPGVGRHEPAPVGVNSSGPATTAPGEEVAGSGATQSSESTLASTHAPQAHPVSPAHEPVPGGYTEAAHPAEPPSPHEPGGARVDDGYGGGDGYDGGVGDRNGPHETSEPGDASPPRETIPERDDTLSNDLTDEKRDEITGLEKGNRPDPADYLSQEYIENHLDKFNDGVTRFMPESNLDKYGIAQSDGTAFVMPTSEADALISEAHGDPRAMEKALGLTEGFLDSNNIVRIDIGEPEKFNLRIPSGNEAGANEQWIPGGLLPDGAAEAIIDGGIVPKGGYSVSDIFEQRSDS